MESAFVIGVLDLRKVLERERIFGKSNHIVVFMPQKTCVAISLLCAIMEALMLKRLVILTVWFSRITLDIFFIVSVTACLLSNLVMFSLCGV